MSIETEDREETRVSSFEGVYDLDLEALIDDELNPARRKIVLAAIQKNPDLKEKYDQLCLQKDMLKLWWKTTPQNT